MNELLTALAESRFVVLALVFAAVFMAAIGVGVLVARNPVSARLSGTKGDNPGATVANVKLRQQGGRWIENPFMKQLARPFMRGGDEQGLSTLRRRLIQAPRAHKRVEEPALPLLVVGQPSQRTGQLRRVLVELPSRLGNTAAHFRQVAEVNRSRLRPREFVGQDRVDRTADNSRFDEC